MNNWEIYSFCIPLLFGGYRKGFVIRLGNRWAEIAPFPGRSQESLEESLEQLRAYFQEGKTEHLAPSVQFGLESLFQPSAFPIKASTYAFLHSPCTDKELIKAKNAGHTTVKIKVGSLPIKQAQALIGSLSQQFRLRVDCNRAFSFQEALTLFSPFDPSVFDYIEDPTYELESLPNFTHPFALDEKIIQYPTPPKHLYGYVLKPTLLGGKKGCLPFIDYAKTHHLKIILSPAFETGLGLLQIVKLGKELDLLHEQIGLDTHRFLAYDILSKPHYFHTPQIHIPKQPKIATNRLKKIAHGTTTLPTLSTSP